MGDFEELLSYLLRLALSSDKKKSIYPSNWDEWAKWTKQRAGYRCQRCGTHNVSLHTHHIVPLAKGSKTDPSNLIALCEGCHSLYHPHLRSRYVKEMFFKTFFGIKPHQYRQRVKQCRLARGIWKWLVDLSEKSTD